MYMHLKRLSLRMSHAVRASFLRIPRHGVAGRGCRCRKRFTCRHSDRRRRDLIAIETNVGLQMLIGTPTNIHPRTLSFIRVDNFVVQLVAVHCICCGRKHSDDGGIRHGDWDAERCQHSSEHLGGMPQHMRRAKNVSNPEQKTRKH